MNGCEKYQEIMSLMLDGEAVESGKTELRAHLATCSECRSVYEAFKAISLSLEALEAPASLAPGVMKAVREIAASEPTPPIPLRNVKRKPKMFARVAAMAACLALIVLAASSADFFGSKPGQTEQEQPVGFGMIGAGTEGDIEPHVKGADDLTDSILPDNDSNTTSDDSCMFAKHDGVPGTYSAENISSVEIYYTAEGPADQATRVLTDQADIQELLDLIKCSDGYSGDVPEGDGDYRISFVSDSPDYGLSVWYYDGQLICRDDGYMETYIAAGEEEELLEILED